MHAAHAHPRTPTRSRMRTYTRRPPFGARNEDIASPDMHDARPDISRPLHRVCLGLKAQMKRSHCQRRKSFPRSPAPPFTKWSYCSAGIFMSVCDPSLRREKNGPMQRADKMAAVAKLTGEAEEDGAESVRADFQANLLFQTSWRAAQRKEFSLSLLLLCLSKRRNACCQM